MQTVKRFLKRINILNLVIYCMYTSMILRNGALLFESYYSPGSRDATLTIFVLTMISLVVAPTFYIAKTDWLLRK